MDEPPVFFPHDDHLPRLLHCGRAYVITQIPFVCPKCRARFFDELATRHQERSMKKLWTEETVSNAIATFIAANHRPPRLSEWLTCGLPAESTARRVLGGSAALTALYARCGVMRPKAEPSARQLVQRDYLRKTMTAQFRAQDEEKATFKEGGLRYVY